MSATKAIAAAAKTRPAVAIVLGSAGFYLADRVINMTLTHMFAIMVIVLMVGAVIMVKGKASKRTPEPPAAPIANAEALVRDWQAPVLTAAPTTTDIDAAYQRLMQDARQH